MFQTLLIQFSSAQQVIKGAAWGHWLQVSFSPPGLPQSVQPQGEGSPEQQLLDSSDEHWLQAPRGRRANAFGQLELAEMARIEIYPATQLHFCAWAQQYAKPHMSCGSKGKALERYFLGGEKKRAQLLLWSASDDKAIVTRRKKARELFLFEILNLDEPWRF